MTHLTEPELYMLLDAQAQSEASPASVSHLAACDRCRAELDGLRTTFSLLREAATSYAASNAPRTLSRMDIKARQPLFGLRPALAGWVSAAVLLAAGAVGLANLHHTAAPVAVNASVNAVQPSPSDEALLQSVSDAIDQPVPSSLSILADPSSQTQSTSQAQPERTN